MDNKWIMRMLQLAAYTSTWSSCITGRQHGCILAVDGKYVVSTGFNGPNKKVVSPKCKDDSGQSCSDVGNCNAIHAEVNSIINAAKVGANLERCIAYCTKQPCEMCRSILINAGIRKVYWMENNRYMEKFNGQCEILNED